MRKLKLTEPANYGGHQLTVNDLKTLQFSASDVAKVIANLVRGTNFTNGFIVAGCETAIIGATYSISEGWIFYNNELWRVPAVPTTTTPVGHLHFLQFNEVPIESTIIYQSGVPKQVHIENQANLITGATQPPNSISLFSVSFANVGTTLQNHISSLSNHESRLATIESAWTSITTGTLSTYLALFNLSTPVPIIPANSFFRFNRVGKTCHIQARIVPSGNWTTARFYMPPSNTPLYTINPPVSAWVNTSTAPLKATFTPGSPAYYLVTQTASINTIDFQTFLEMA